MKEFVSKLFLWAIFSFALVGCAGESATDTGITQEISYNWDVRPIISDNCFACHGPDADGGQKAGLRLDQFETATAELPESPGLFAIVPGDTTNSELIRRITSTDPNVQMPPPESNKSLTQDEKEVLTQWIEQGAKYERHWAYVPVVRPALPTDIDPNQSSPIDLFVREKLTDLGLDFTDQADKATLFNRVSMDLTGLPPSEQDLANFLADGSSNAYEKQVDKLLNSPAYAEHMAGQWLDIARWADTDGYLEDAGSRLLHPWRDWLISAYERNLPFDTFLTWQLAGDLLADPTEEQILATTFLRLGQRSSENGIIDSEYKNEYAIDRVETVGAGILGHTVGCARCHDHKYDPISIKDFYSFAAFFGDTYEPGFYTPGGSMPFNGFIGIESGATLQLPDTETKTELVRLKSAEKDAYTQYQEVLRKITKEINGISTPKNDQLRAELSQSVSEALDAHYSFERYFKRDLEFAKVKIFGRQEHGKPLSFNLSLPAGLREDLIEVSPSNIVDQVPAILQAPLHAPGYKGEGFLFDEQNKGYFGDDVGDFDRTDPFTLDLWVKLGRVYEDATLINHNQHIRFAGNGYALDLLDNHLRFRLQHSPDNKIDVLTKESLDPEVWHHLTVVYDGLSRADGVVIYLNGQPLDFDVSQDNLTQTLITPPLAFIDDTLYGLAFGKRWQQYTIAGSVLDEVKVFKRNLSPLEVRYIHDTENLLVSEEAYRDYRLQVSPEALISRNMLRKAQAAYNVLYSSQPEIMVMQDNPLAADFHVKQRGVYTNPGEAVEGTAFDQIFAFAETLPNNRLGLAQWLFDPQNPLTSRVQVNRLWQSVFGRGLVETAEDFGTQGAKPTHPELLDWLAAEFIDSGWDQKAILKQMVMSSTYKQASMISAVKKDKDPYNHYLSRGVRQRYSAEQIRDSALFAAGLLEQTVGGKSVYPYQPEGVWKAVSVNQPVDYPLATDVPLDDHHRRTMYGYVKRASAHPALQVFDFPQRIITVARRRTSNTPLQALVLLNDRQYLEAYAGMAYRALNAREQLSEQLDYLYRLGMRREPSQNEREILTHYYQRALQRFLENHEGATLYLSAGLENFPVPVDNKAEFAALAATARVVMNSPDAYSKH